MNEYREKVKCSHLAFMVNREHEIEHISFTDKACVQQYRGSLIGRRCYEVLWNLPQPCRVCPVEQAKPESEEVILSHLQHGLTSITDGMVSESVLPFTRVEPAAYIVLLEPVVPTPVHHEDGENAFILPVFDYFEEDSKGRDYLMHLQYHRMFYQQFYEHDLTHTEQEVALFILQGLSSKEIADRLFISKKSVDFHRHNIRKKLGLVGKRVSIGNFLQNLLQVASDEQK